MGNVLQGDDGFGVRVLEALARDRCRPGVRLVEVGIGGIHLVQALMDGWDALVLVDAVDRGGPPGTVYVLEPVVPDWETLPATERSALLADTHYAVPARVLTLARALGILPARVYVVGCQPRRIGLGLGLSEAVAPAVAKGSACVRRLLEDLTSVEREGIRSGEPAAEAAVGDP